MRWDHSHDEQPPPSSDTVQTLHLQDGRSNETAKGITKLLADEEDCKTLAELALGIPCRKEEDGSREEDSLGDTQEEASHEEVLIGLDCGCASRDCTPKHDRRADVYALACFMVDEASGHSQSPGRVIRLRIRLLGIWKGM